jgi:hypothetical protein
MIEACDMLWWAMQQGVGTMRQHQSMRAMSSSYMQFACFQQWHAHYQDNGLLAQNFHIILLLLPVWYILLDINKFTFNCTENAHSIRGYSLLHKGRM